MDSTGDSNSIYYSITESLWEATGESYVKETFIHQSVWSDDEDDMSVCDTLLYMVVACVIPDNEVAAKFTNKDDSFFDVNEFLGMNQCPNPDTSLNFQARQSQSNAF